VVCERECHRDTALEVHLLQGLPKGDKLELVLQKTTELGAARLTPVLTARSVPVRDAAREGRRLERWQRIVTEATRQCGRAQVPQVDAPLPLAQALSQVSAEMRLVAWEKGGRSLSSLAESFSPLSVAVLIGPEGGLEASEVALAQDFGFLPVTLGPRILRTETAGMVLAAWIQLIWGDMG
jgi:16S rRNA (uracil1498-N3)-methyltransferase